MEPVSTGLIIVEINVMVEVMVVIKLLVIVLVMTMVVVKVVVEVVVIDADVVWGIVPVETSGLTLTTLTPTMGGAGGVGNVMFKPNVYE